ncbi:hypothetical protein A7D27_11605 [Pseudomonas sp. 1D4]|uniref:DUF3168 domain-containing protein n=1 Tax=Metapseudomonas otitidis TaxID=319939 RepID=A0A7X3HDD7_9GAMM|nr:MULTISPECIES: DUF3168 domain-containing protein [Pseudomonas]MDH0337642.1 DUF3168 domain-containing protein [Pseudomonas otitidis]MWK58711.1 DUF3168 domain-containing protein [Pseudomonas otitidis]OEC42517.1 hypothetical protein A7D27_11605 [Pseudomonas sp. 1D4]
MFAPIFAVCAASPAVLAALGADPVRLYPFGEAPEGVAKPYATWQGIGGGPENNINQAPEIDRFALQVDVFADSAASARESARALRDAIEPHAHITSWSGESRDPATGSYRYSFDVDWWVER